MRVLTATPTCSHYNSTALYETYVHIQIPPTGYVGLILCSTTVATASWSTFEGTMRVL